LTLIWQDFDDGNGRFLDGLHLKQKIWQAITLVGDARERLQEVEPSKLEASLAEVESLLISAISDAAQHLGRRYAAARAET
jgi:hypothetical protein